MGCREGLFSALHYLCCLGFFLPRASVQAVSSSPRGFVREALPLGDKQEEWPRCGEHRVRQGLLWMQLGLVLLSDGNVIVCGEDRLLLGFGEGKCMVFLSNCCCVRVRVLESASLTDT